MCTCYQLTEPAVSGRQTRANVPSAEISESGRSTRVGHVAGERVERHAEVRITVIGDPDREEGEVPVELGDGLAQLAGRGVLAQAVAWA